MPIPVSRILLAPVSLHPSLELSAFGGLFLGKGGFGGRLLHSPALPRPPPTAALGNEAGGCRWVPPPYQQPVTLEHAAARTDTALRPGYKLGADYHQGESGTAQKNLTQSIFGTISHKKDL